MEINDVNYDFVDSFLKIFGYKKETFTDDEFVEFFDELTRKLDSNIFYIQNAIEEQELQMKPNEFLQQALSSYHITDVGDSAYRY